MTRGPHRTVTRLAAAVGLVAAVVLPTLPATTAGAATPGLDDDAPALVVGTIDPAVVTAPRSRLSIGGTAVAGADDLSGATVRLRVSTIPVSTRTELGALTSGDQQRDGVERASSVELDVPAGTRAAWSLSVPASALGLGEAGVYPLSIDLYDGGSTVPLTSTVSFLSWYPRGTVMQPTRLTWVVPLAGRPVRDADGTFLDDGTAADVATGGRLRTLVDALAERSVDWAFDPELLEASAQMADGYRVVREDGSVAAGGAAGSEAARAFLERVRGVLGTDAAALAYADPDADALQRAGLERDLTAAVTTGSEVAETLLDHEVRRDVAVPAGGFLDRRALTTLRAAGVRTVVLSDAAVPLSTPLNYTPDGVARLSTPDGGVVAALADSTLSSVVATPEDLGGDDLARQRFLAETLVVTKERPSVSRALVVAPPRDWDVSAGFASEVVALSSDAPWLDPLPLAELRRIEPPDGVERAGLNHPSDDTQLSARQTTAAAELGRLLETLTGVLDDAARTTARYRAAILRTESSAWQVDRRTGTALADAVRTGLERDIGKVRILSRGTVTLSGDEGRIPITVANDLDQDVVVEVRVSTRTPGRFSVEQPGELRIGARRKESLEIPARAASGGTVPVQVQLFTRDGEPYGEAVEMNVRSSAYSRLGAAVVGAALAALVTLVAARLLRRFRRYRRGDEQAEPDVGA